MTKQLDAIAYGDLEIVKGGESSSAFGSLSLFRKLIIDPTRSIPESFDPLSLASPKVNVSSFGRDDTDTAPKLRLVPRRFTRGTTRIDVKPAAKPARPR
ncbi:MAG TPA: hypothetical protein VIV11_33330 [Kofleriaceae bacterium]